MRLNAARFLPLVLLVFVPSIQLHAQELKYLDLAEVSQRTQLRHPPVPPTKCKDGKPCAVPGGFGAGSIGDGAPDWRDPRAIGVSLERVNPTEINPAQPFDVEFKVLNTGRVPISIPVSPHLSDLQPSDSSVRFEYFSIALVVGVAGVPNGKDVISMGFVELYGSEDHEGTMLPLKPGEWIRVKAAVKLRQSPLEATDATFRGEFWLRKNTFQPQAGGFSSHAQNLYPNQTPTPSIPVHLLRPDEEQPQQINTVPR
jgi:hypothetical protein